MSIFSLEVRHPEVQPLDLDFLLIEPLHDGLLLGHGGEAGHEAGLGPGHPHQGVELALVPRLPPGGDGHTSLFPVPAPPVHVVSEQLGRQPELKQIVINLDFLVL